METNQTPQDLGMLNEMIERESAIVGLLAQEMNKVIVGQKHMIERLLIGLLSQGHILLEGVPGLAKTLAINTLSKAVKGSFSRVQFTPDLLPADVIGTMINNVMGKFTEDDLKKELETKEYEYGFYTDIESETFPIGLNEDIVRAISKKKEEPEWMTQWRLEAFKIDRTR